MQTGENSNTEACILYRSNLYT